MKTNRLGESDVWVSEISLGCWTMGGLNWVNGQANGWANVDEDEIVEGLRLAVHSGVNHFDNADVYGNGRAERMLARAMKKLGLRTEEFVIATKIGHFPGTAGHAYEPAHIRHQCEQSLINLQRDYLDIYYFHHGDFGQDGALLDDAVEVMNRLVEEGKVRLKGQSAYNDAHFERAVAKLQPSVLQSWANIESRNFIEPDGVVGRLLESEKMSYVAFSPLGQGRLLGKFDPEKPPQFDEGDHRRGKRPFSAEGLRELGPKIEAMKARFGGDIETLSSVAQRFVLSYPRVACVIPGFRNADQVRCNLAAEDFTLSEEDLQFLRELFRA